MKIVVGLGNPGKEYEKTRHNCGFMFLEYLEDKYNFKISNKKFDALIAETNINGNRVVFVKPQTYMNLSGNSVSKVKNWYKVEDKDILIVFDDIDIPFGEYRYKESGSGGSHNGMKNVVSMLSSKNMPRLRIGIGNIKHEKQDIMNFVLEKFTKSQLEELNKVFEDATEKFEYFIDKE